MVAAVVTAFVHARQARSLDRLLNIVAAGSVTLAVSALWYVPNYSEFRADIKSSTSIPAWVQGDPPVGSLASALWYLWSLLNNQLYLIPFLFLVTGIVFLFRKDEAAIKNAPLLLSVVGSYIALSAIELKDFRYTMPMIAAIGVIATSWLEFVGPRLRRWLGGGLLAYCVMTFFVISFGTGLLPKDITIPLKPRSFTSDLADFAPPESGRITGIVVFAQHGFRVGPPSSEEWHQEDVVEGDRDPRRQDVLLVHGAARDDLVHDLGHPLLRVQVPRALGRIGPHRGIPDHPWPRARRRGAGLRRGEEILAPLRGAVAPLPAHMTAGASGRWEPWTSPTLHSLRHGLASLLITHGPNVVFVGR